MQACFELGGKKYCFYVPIIKLPRPPIDFIEPGKPDPTPWLESPAISREVAYDLSVLAGIDVLVKALKTPRLKKQFTQSLNAAIPCLDLPKEVSINYDDQQGINKSDCRA
ncbi:hypothetical protein [Methylomonas sp. MK1]|uniref:hypothetical protein n=1 Tax=Methylomonas sp. MK1 TaxID=1131552 RepID=UPI00038172E9|nr:hypothetical protein [Methylomonas sp. MK1]